jgi:Fur family transcriptional regulator, ferric uptake regulator
MASRRASQLDDLRTAIRGAGLRATPSRLAVLELLRGETTPLSHAEVADRLGDNAGDKATVYRNLMDMARVGLLRRTDVGDHVWRFERAADGEEPEHPHFVCTDCGTVECLPDLRISVRQAAAAPASIRERQVEVQLRGLCDTCR